MLIPKLTMILLSTILNIPVLDKLVPESLKYFVLNETHYNFRVPNNRIITFEYRIIAENVRICVINIDSINSLK